MTLTEILAVMNAFGRKREMKLIDDVFLAWNFGKYAAIGVNAPKKYPKWDGIEKELKQGFKKNAQPQKVQTADEMERRCKMMAAAMGSRKPEGRGRKVRGKERGINPPA